MVGLILVLSLMRIMIAEHKLILHTQNFIGSNDWEDFNNGKEGVRRYRHEDLPPKNCAGLYELGVAVIDQEIGQKFDADNVFATYLGQSIDLRSRVQDYGRSGGHLPPGLFKDVFSEQGSIFFRWAPVNICLLIFSIGLLIIHL